MERATSCGASVNPASWRARRDGVNLDVKSSLGIAIYPEHGDAADAMIQDADTATCKPRKAGVGYRSYDPEDDPHSLRRLTLTGEPRTAVEKNELVLHFQPEVDLQTHTAVGVEALVRWQHPTHGVVPPDELIPLAEQAGLLRPLTDWVLNEAVRRCSLWRQQGLNLNVAVNLSAHNPKDAADGPETSSRCRSHQWRSAGPRHRGA